MLEFVSLQPDDIPELARFIASQQAQPSSYVGFCGSQPDEIAHELSEFPDLPAEQAFVLARENGQIVGALGFDADLEKQRAYVWGPVVTAAAWDEVAEQLWRQVAAKLPASNQRLDVFCHTQNGRVQAWAGRREIPFHSQQFIMAFDRAQLAQLPPAATTDLVPGLHQQFIDLHELSFPKTYYSGPEIIGRLNAEQRVLVVAEGAKLLGYTYIEAKPEFGEGHIEFIAVDQGARGKGVGLTLLAGALRWLFGFESVSSIELVVDGANPAARSLYRRAGFTTRYEMVNFRQG
jgi:GNAT superfamily N-acetyltransferase